MVPTTITTGTITSGTSVNSTSLAKELIQGKLDAFDNRKPPVEPITLRLTECGKLVVNSLQNVGPIGFKLFSHNLKQKRHPAISSGAIS